MWRDGKLLFLAASCLWQPDGMAETHFWARESHVEGAVAFVTDKLSPGCTPPCRESEGFRAREERNRHSERKRGRERKEEKGRETQVWVSKSCRNKLAVSCGGTGGETEMDTHIPAKAGGGWKLTAYPGPFHSLPIQQLTSLPAFELGFKKKDISPITSDCSFYTKANNVHGIHVHAEHRHTGLAIHVHSLNINLFSTDVQSHSYTMSYTQKSLQAKCDTLYDPPTCTNALHVCTHAHAQTHTHIIQEAH